MVSLALIVCFVPVPGVSFGAETNMENTSAFSVSSVAIPTHLGSIQESFQGEKNKTVIYIQDAHANYEAQSHISEILQYLTETYGINEVNTEGAEGPVDLALFKALPFPEIKKEILDKDMRSGNTAGAEFFAMTSPKDITLLGVDDDEHYLKNVGQYAALARKKKMYSHSLKFFQKVTDNLKSVMYSEEARAVDRLIKKNNSSRIPMDHFVKELAIYSEKAKIDLSDYPTVSELNTIMTAKQSVGAGLAPARLGRPQGPPLQSPRDNDTDGIREISTPLHPTESLVSHLFQPAVAEAADHSNGTDRMEEKIPDMPEGIDAKKLFDELDELKEELLNVFAKDSESKELVRLDRYLELLTQGLDLKLTPDDAKLLRGLRKEFKEDYLREYLTMLSRKHRLNEPALDNVLKSGLDDFSKLILDFYETVEARDKIMVNNLKRSAKRENPVSILVAGGFHTAGVTERLRKEKVSYVVIQPNIGAASNENAYPELMLKWGNIVSAQATARTVIAQDVYKVNNWNVALQMAEESNRSLQPMLTEFSRRVLSSGKMTPEAFAEELSNASNGELFSLVSPEGVVVFSRDLFYDSLSLAGRLGGNPDEILHRRAMRFPVKIAAAGLPAGQAGFGAEQPAVLAGSWSSKKVDAFERNLRDSNNLFDEEDTAVRTLKQLENEKGHRSVMFFSRRTAMPLPFPIHTLQIVMGQIKEDLNHAVIVAGPEMKNALEELQHNYPILIRGNGDQLIAEGYYIPQKSGILRKAVAQYGKPTVSSLLELAELEGLIKHADIVEDWERQRSTILSVVRQFDEKQWKELYTDWLQYTQNDVKLEFFADSVLPKPVDIFRSTSLPVAHNYLQTKYVEVTGSGLPPFYTRIKSVQSLGNAPAHPSPLIELLASEYYRFFTQRKVNGFISEDVQRLKKLSAPVYLGDLSERAAKFAETHKNLVWVWGKFTRMPVPENLRLAELNPDAEYYRSPLSDLINDVLGIDVANQIAKDQDRARRRDKKDAAFQPVTMEKEQEISESGLDAEATAWLEKKLSSVDSNYRTPEYLRFAEELLMLSPKIQSRLVKLGGKIWYAEFVTMKRGKTAYRDNHKRILELLISNGISAPTALAEAIPEYWYIYSEDIEGFHTPLPDFVWDVISSYREYVRERTEKERMRKLVADKKEKLEQSILSPETETAQPKPTWLKRASLGLVSLVQSWWNRPSEKPFLIGKPSKADVRAAEERARLPKITPKSPTPAKASVIPSLVAEQQEIQETGLPLSRERQVEAIEPFREVTRAEVDEMTGKLSALDAALIHNDARVTFEQLYEALNPESLDDALLSRPEIRKLIDSILENLRKLSNPVLIPKINGEASKLKRRLDYIRNLLAMINGRRPATILEPEQIKEEVIHEQIPPEPEAAAGFGAAKATPAQRAARNYIWKFPIETAQAIGFDDESVAANYLAKALATDPLKQFEISRARLLETVSKGGIVFGPGGNKMLEKLLIVSDKEIRKVILEKHWAVLQNQSYPNRLNQLPAFVSEQLLADRNSLDQRLLSADSSAARLRKQLESIGFYGVPLNYLLDAREELGNFINSLSPEQQAKFSSEVTALQAYITNYLIAAKAMSIAA